jgi:hypothetical protein
MCDDDEREKAAEAAVAEVCKGLALLAKPGSSWAIVGWNDPIAASDPRDEYEAAIEYVIALLQQQPASALIERRIAALRLGRPPKRKGRRSNLLRDRGIAGMVTTICQRHGFNPYRNQENKHEHNGCAIVSKGLRKLGIDMTEENVRQIYMRHKA